MIDCAAPSGGAALPKGECRARRLWSAKGGSGTTVVAAALALVPAGRGEAPLADLGGDLPGHPRPAPARPGHRAG